MKNAWYMLKMAAYFDMVRWILKPRHNWFGRLIIRLINRLAR